MLTLTDNATLIVKDITAQPEITEGASLRITAETGDERAFAVSAGHRQPGDQVVEQQGATLFLDETAAQILDDKVLDAAVDESGSVEFALAFQA